MSLVSLVRPYAIVNALALGASITAHSALGGQARATTLLTGTAFAMSVLGAFAALTLTFGTCVGGCEDSQPTRHGQKQMDPVSTVFEGLILGGTSAVILTVLFLKSLGNSLRSS